MTDVTKILNQICQGSSGKSDELLPLVYEELRNLAAGWMAYEKAGQTLQPTALVHEAYLRLVKQDSDLQWDNRGHFFSAAATAMRRILVENARRKRRRKRGGNLQRAFLESAEIDVSTDNVDLLDLEEGLSEFEVEYPDRARVLHLRFFAGLSYTEIATFLAVSESTVKRHWLFARVWLHRRLNQ